MSNNKNLVPGIVTGLLQGGLNYLAKKHERAKEEEQFQRRLQYQYQLDQVKSDRDMQDWTKKNQYNQDLASQSYDTFDKAAGFKTIPEIQTTLNTDSLFNPESTSPVFNILGMGRRTNPFENLSEEEYYRNLAAMQRNDALSGTKTADQYQSMGEKMNFQPAMPMPKYKTDINDQTGEITYYDENNPNSKPIVVSAPETRKNRYQLESSSTSPYIMRINLDTGQKTNLGRNPAYRPQRSFSVQDGYGIGYDYNSGRVTVTPIAELVKDKQKDTQLKDLNNKFIKTMSDINTYNVSERMGQKDIYDSQGKIYKPDDFVNMVKTQRSSLAEEIKSYLGDKRGIYDSLWNDWQNDKITEYDFKSELWNKVSDMFDQGQLNANEADMFSKLYYLTWGMFPSEAKKQEMRMGGR